MVAPASLAPARLLAVMAVVAGFIAPTRLALAAPTTEATVPSAAVDKHSSLSLGASFGSVSADEGDALKAWILRANYRTELSRNWALSVDYPIVGKTLTDHGPYGDDQNAWQLGAPLFQATRTIALHPQLSLCVGGGLTAGIPRALYNPANHAGESVADLVAKGTIYSLLSGQRERPNFEDRVGTLVAPLKLHYAAKNGLFLTTEASLDLGLDRDLILDLRGSLEVGYSNNHLFGSLSGMAYRELISQLGKTQAGELDYVGGSHHQLSAEASLGVDFARIWLRGRGLYGRYDELNTFAGSLDVGTRF